MSDQPKTKKCLEDGTDNPVDATTCGACGGGSFQDLIDLANAEACEAADYAAWAAKRAAEDQHEGSGSGRYDAPGVTDWLDRGTPDFFPKQSITQLVTGGEPAPQAQPCCSPENPHVIAHGDPLPEVGPGGSAHHIDQLGADSVPEDRSDAPPVPADVDRMALAAGVGPSQPPAPEAVLQLPDGGAMVIPAPPLVPVIAGDGVPNAPVAPAADDAGPVTQPETPVALPSSEITAPETPAAKKTSSKKGGAR